MAYQNNEILPIAQFVEQAYLDYSMYVILDRALPHLGDGLKPVQRRIVYAMSELGLSHAAKYKKSARTVGDVLGKFHPHGDSACYEAMVLMAQNFSYRYPLVDGQGNWGAIDDPKSFAAMRYTESKLDKYAQVLLRELGQGTVDWQDNFDGSLKEPKILPALLPNILLNGAQGIAVGMSTDIPSHNVADVARSCLALIDDPQISDTALADCIQGPDFPTYGELITSQSDLRALYQTGSGSVKLRATYVLEDKTLVITSLPYQVASGKIIEQIATQMRNKKLPMIEDLRDESDEQAPVRLVLLPKSSRTDLEQVMGHLFATTDLEKSYRVQFNMIGLDHRPAVKNLKTILSEWLIFRRQVVVKRLQYRLDAVNRRLHLLDGLLIAFLNLDEVIRIVREEDVPKVALIATFALSEVQAEYILETKLRQLARLEEMQLQAEQAKLLKEQKQLQTLLASDAKLTRLIRDEIETAASEFGDARKTQIIERQAAKAIDERVLAPSEVVTVVLSKMGWVRQGKGNQLEAENLPYKTGDAYGHHAIGRSNQTAVFLASDGRAFSLPAYQLPSARGLGEPLTGKLDLGQRQLCHVLLAENQAQFLFASQNGYGFISEYENLISRAKAGKAFMSITDSPACLPIKWRDAEQYLLIITNEDYVLLIARGDIPILPRGKGNKLIHIPPKSLAAGICVGEWRPLVGDETLRFAVGRKKITLQASEWLQWLGERGKRGKRLPNDLQSFKALEIIAPNAGTNSFPSEHLIVTTEQSDANTTNNNTADSNATNASVENAEADNRPSNASSNLGLDFDD